MAASCKTYIFRRCTSLLRSSICLFCANAREVPKLCLICLGGTKLWA
jgi:hypothetical protein